MLDPYKMVLVNSVTSAMLIVVMLFYVYIYPKKKMNFFAVLIIISLLPLISIFRTGAYESGDFNIHLYRAIEFYNSLKDGHLMPSWAGGLNATYGYPLFIFNYPLPYYFISLFHFIGFSFITSMKLFLAFSFILSGIFIYIFTKDVFKNSIAAFTAAVFYQFAPYHLIDLHFKVVIGEILAFTILPLVFFSFHRLWKEKNARWIVLSGIFVALLIMAHVSLALFSIALLLCYAIFLYFILKKRVYIFETLISIFIGSVASVYVWLTPFFMSKYTILKEVYGFPYFPQIYELLYSPWRLGFLFQGHKGELSFLLGYAHVLILIFTIILLIQNKIIGKYKAYIFYWLLAFFIIIFLITPYSKFIWGVFPFLKITGSHRLLLLAAFVSSILAGYISLHLLKRQIILYALIAFAIFSTILNWGQRRVIPGIDDQYLIANVWESTSKVEGHFYANSKFRDMKNPWFTKLPKQHLEILKGEGEIKELSRNSTEHRYLVKAKNAISLRENTLYFPGWNVYDNKLPLSVSHDKDGVIFFNLKAGIHDVGVKYSDLFVYKLLKTVSLVTFLVLTIYLLLEVFLKRFMGDN